MPCACTHDFFSLLRLLLAPHPLVDASLAASLRTLFFGGSCFSAHVVSLPPPTHDFLSPSLRHLLPSLPDARVESEFWKSFRLHFTPHPLVGVSLAARCAVRRLRVVPRVRPLTRSSSFLLPVLTLHWVRMRRRCVPHGALPRFHFRRFSRIAPAVVRCVRFAAHVVLGGSCFSAHVVSLPSPIHRTFTRGLAATRRVARSASLPRLGLSRAAEVGGPHRGGVRAARRVRTVDADGCSSPPTRYAHRFGALLRIPLPRCGCQRHALYSELKMQKN